MYGKNGFHIKQDLIYGLYYLQLLYLKERYPGLFTLTPPYAFGSRE